MKDKPLVAVADRSSGVWLVYSGEDALYRAHVSEHDGQRVFQNERTQYCFLSSNEAERDRVYFRDISLAHSRWCGQDADARDEIREAARIALLERILNCCRAEDPARQLVAPA